MKRDIITSPIILLVIAVIATASILLLNNINKEVVVENEEKTEFTKKITKDESYLETKYEYMEGCVEGDPATYKFCECTFDSLYSELGHIGILEMGLEYELTGIMTKEMKNAMTQCISLF